MGNQMGDRRTLKGGKAVIKEAGRRDLFALSVIGSATFLDAFSDILAGENILGHIRRQHSLEAYERYLENGAKAWLAINQNTGAVIGYALNTEPDLPVEVAPGDVELKRIYLLRAYYGCGVGEALLAAAKADAKRNGAGRLLLGVYEGNERALGFYKRTGFIDIGTRQFQVGDGVYSDRLLALDL